MSKIIGSEKDEVKMTDLVECEVCDFYEIYKLTCKSTSKIYIGQAVKFLSRNKPWGTHNRWKTHITEAFKSKKDHCVALNNALRKYGATDFIVEIIADNIPFNEIDDLEVKLIRELNAKVPNGYNIQDGGGVYRKKLNNVITEQNSLYDSNIKESENMSTINDKNKTDEHIPAKVKPKTVVVKGKGKKAPVNNPVDNQHVNKIAQEPINLIDKEQKQTKYRTCIIEKVVEDQKEYIVTYVDDNDQVKKMIFTNKIKDHDITANKFYNDKLELEKKKIELLNIELGDSDDETKPARPNALVPPHLLATTIKNKTARQKLKLHKNIFPMYSPGAKLIGYYVDGFPDHEGIPYPKKEFTSLSAVLRDKQAAERYIKELEIRNKDAVFVEKIPADLDCKSEVNLNKRKPTNSNLPMYLTSVIVEGKKIGYQVNNFPVNKTTYIKKKFSDTELTLEEKYNLAIDFLRKLWDQKENVIAEVYEV